jgi:hypothetical protein
MVRLNFSPKMRMRWSGALPQILHGSADCERIEALLVVAGYPSWQACLRLGDSLLWSGNTPWRGGIVRIMIQMCIRY